jgi:oxamate amidohydrolase
MAHSEGPRTGRPPFRARRGMISTSHYLASVAGLKILRAGGSAVDAAIAANAVLCVAYPHMAGLGGDGFWLIHHPREGRVEALNASGPSAAMATRDFYREAGHEDEIPDRGPLAALTVPGAVDGWREAHERYGKLEWRVLFEDAIYHAREGLAVSRSLANWIHEDMDLFSDQPSSGRIFTDNGKARREGGVLAQQELARSLERLAEHGPRAGFYEGDTARSICKALEEAGSPLRRDDFANFRAEWVEPLTTTYRGYEAFEFPPNTQGFAALQILNLIEGFDLKAFGDNSADYYHHMAEAVKLAFADRDAWLTDPKFVDIPLEWLLSKEYANERRKQIKASSSLDMDGVDPGIPFDEAEFTSRGARGDTCYFCAVDEDGLSASVIQSIYYDFGSGVVGGDTGIIMQNRGSFFEMSDNHPNRLEPHKRTFHTLIPAMLLKDGEPYLVYGTMGGEGQPQTHAAMVSRLIDFGYDVQQAIEAPRWLMGQTWGAESRDLWLEGRIPDNVVRELELRGQPVMMLQDWNDNMGHAQAIRIDRESGLLEGGADPRGDGLALGF